jgi:predicted MFS family arabinose efflux permease
MTMSVVASTSGTRRTRAWIIVLFMTISVFASIDRNIIVILQEQIRREFDLKDWQLGFMTGTAISFFFATMAVPFARLADRGMARTAIIVVAVAGRSLMTAGCGLAQSFVQLVAARFAVGFSDAGGFPATYSMVSDIFPRDERARAIAIITLGMPLGSMLGLLLGGWIAFNFGWHKALVIVGLPGLLLALLFRMTVREPPRGMADGKQITRDDHIPMGQALRIMLANRTYMNVLVAGLLGSACSFGINVWFAPFFMRDHGMSIAQVGIGGGLVVGVAGVTGILGGGWLCDHLGKRDPRLMVLVPMAAMLIAVPFYWASLTVGSAFWSLALLFVPTVMNSIWIAPATALAQSLVPPPMRATSAATNGLVHNLVSGAVVPPLLGVMSDLLAARTGSPAEGLRWMLLLLGVFYFWAAAHFWAAAKTIEGDLL